MIFDKRDLKFERLGYMVDCSRGAVPKIETLKKFVDYLSEFGYTYLELYIEDVYEIEGEPYFGYMRGRYTAVEIAELDVYAKQKGIELIPCIQTLAHLERIKKYNAYAHMFEIDNILMVGNDEVYALIEKMLISVGKINEVKSISSLACAIYFYSGLNVFANSNTVYEVFGAKKEDVVAIIKLTEKKNDD